jgi:molybdate transport system ATP-binding protein
MKLKVSVEHSFRRFTVAAAFEAPAEGITVLFGPSGCGKSTILAAIAGLIRTDRIRVELAGEKLHALAPEKRRIGMVFQEGRLFPHLNVRQNLLYGLKRAPRGNIFIDETLALLGLEPLLGRRPATLSGGERQRVAIGRALLSQPRLLVMDEPLASLDAARRGEILPYLARLRDQLHLPMVYVTHALDVAIYLADHLVLLENGRVLASGALPDLAARVDLPLAARDDAAGVLTGMLHAHDYERKLSEVACGGQIYYIPLARHIAPRTAVRLRIPARDVILALDAPRECSVNNIIPAVVCGVGPDPTQLAALVEVDVGGGVLLARVTQDAAQRLRLRPGVRVLAMVKSMVVEILG